MEITFEKYPVDDKHIDSFWYYDSVIAIIRDAGIAVHIEAHGDIGVYFETDGELYKDENAVNEAIERNLNDDDLKKLSEHDGWSNNNWFEIFVEDESTGEGDYIDSIYYDYEEAINGGIEEILERNYTKNLEPCT